MNAERMEKMKKRLFAGLAAGLVAFSCCFASLPERVFQSAIAEDQEIVTSGDCGAEGSNLTWSIEGETLLITGEGKMRDYEEEEAPWFNHSGLLKSIAFSEGITGIGSFAFSKMQYLEHVSFPESLRTINASAFADCTMLREAHLPMNLTMIGEDAFSGCIAMMELQLPQTVGLIIGKRAFRSCHNLLKLDMEELQMNAAAQGDEAITLLTIRERAFSDCSALSEVRLPEGFVGLGEGVFEDCINLYEIILPKSLKSINKNMFSNCRRLSNLTIPNNVTAIGDGAFQDCINLTNLIIPQNVTSIGDHVLSGCVALHTLTILNGSCKIGDDNATSSYTVVYGQPDSTAHIYAQKNGYDFHEYEVSVINSGNCGAEESNVTWALTSEGTMYISGEGEMYDKISTQYPWNKYKNLIKQIVIESGVTRIGNQAFSACDYLETVECLNPDCHIDNTINYKTGFESKAERESFAPRGDISLTVSSDDPRFGAFCLAVTNRQEHWNGIEIPLKNLHITEGMKYTFSVWVKPAKAQAIRFIFGHLYTDSNKLTAYSQIAAAESQGKWVQLKASYTLPKGSQNDAVLYIETSSATSTESSVNPVDFYVDDLLIKNEGAHTFGQNVAIYGFTGSTAEAYAHTYGNNFRTLDAPAVTTAPATTTAAPVTTASSTSKTTAAPVTTSSSTSKTTAAPVTTSSSTSKTTAAPVTTSSSTSKTTAAPVTTSSSTSKTTAAPVTTSSSTSKTTAAPVATSSSTSKTTAAPVTTSSSTSKTTAAPVTVITTAASAIQYTKEFTLQLQPSGHKVYDMVDEVNSVEISNESVAKVLISDNKMALNIQALRAGTCQITVILKNGSRYIMYLTVINETTAPVQTTTAAPATTAAPVQTTAAAPATTAAPVQTTTAAPVTTTVPVTTTAAAKIIDSGECGAEGNNLTWTLDEDGVLIISGKGFMQNYLPTTTSLSKPAPWSSQRQNITKVIIKSGVQDIGECAFASAWSSERYSHLVSVSIPDTVISIGNRAFDACSALTTIEVANGNTEYASHDGALFNADKTYLFWMPAAKISFQIPDSMTEITDSMFSGCTQLRSVTIPNSVTKIGKSAFSGCSSLVSLEIPETVTQIGDKAFCQCSGLKKINLPKAITEIGEQTFYLCSGLVSLNIPNSVEQIGKSAFSGCSGIKTITLPSKVSRIEPSTFASCTNLESVTLPYGLTDIYANAFDGCTKLSACTLPETLETLGNNAFHGCTSLKEISLQSKVKEIGPGTFFNCAFSKLTIPGNIKTIGEGAFKGCSHLYQLTLSDGLQTVMKTAFSDCTSLNNVVLPRTLTAIESMAFSNCENLKTVTVLSRACTFADQTVFPSALELHGCRKSTAEDFAESSSDITFIPVDLPGDANLDGEVTNEDVNRILELQLGTAEDIDPQLSDRIFVNADVNKDGKINSIDASMTMHYIETGSFDNMPETTAPVTTTAPQTTLPTTATSATTTTTTQTTTTTETTTPTTTTTTTETTETTTTTTASSFVPGYDSWGFKNKNKIIAKKGPKNADYYFMTPEHQKALESELSNIEKTKISEALSNTCKGFCYGMSTAAILQTTGLLSPADFMEGIENIGQINSENITDNVRSIITYYQMLQYTKTIRRMISETLGKNEHPEDLLRSLIDSVKAGKPTLFCYFYNEPESVKRGGHAIVAYDIAQEIQKSITLDKTYQFDTEIKVYDSLRNNEEGEFNILINTRDWYWCIPTTAKANEYKTNIIMNSKEYRDGRIGLISSDPALLNHHGLINGSESTEPEISDAAYGEMSFAPFNGFFKFFAIKDGSDDSFYAGDNEVDIFYISNSFGDDEESSTEPIVASVDGNYSYVLSLDKDPEPIDLTMEYDDCLISANAERGKSFTVTPQGGVIGKNVQGKYSISEVLNEGHHPTDWCSLRIDSEDGGEVSLRQFGNGWILKGNLNNEVLITASTLKDTASLPFFTKYDQVLIYEIDKNKIGIQADTDGDGKFDETIARNYDPLKGDINGDGTLKINDAVLYSKYLAEEEMPFCAFDNTDYNGDGEIDIFDLTALLGKLAEN